jgi:hypothetical protein
MAICVMYSGLTFVWVLMHVLDPLYYSSDLPGFDPTTLDGMILYYRLMAKVNKWEMLCQYRSYVNIEG